VVRVVVEAAVPVMRTAKSPESRTAAMPVMVATSAARVQAVPAPAQVPAVRRRRFTV
jgi:hypothetical protein